MNRIRQYLPIVCWAFGAVLVVNTVRMVRINRSLTLQITNFYRSIELPAGARPSRRRQGRRRARIHA